MDQFGPFCLLGHVYLDPSIWTGIFGHVSLAPLIWTQQFELDPFIWDLFVWTRLIGLVCLDTSIEARLLVLSALTLLF